MALSIRQTIYRGEPGLLLCGTCSKASAWGVSIFIKGRELRSRRIAQWIKAEVKKGNREWRFEEAYAAVDTLEEEERRSDELGL